MENKNILMLRHHPCGVKYSHSFYINQTEGNLEDYIIIDVTSRVTRDKEFMGAHPNFDKEISPFYLGPVMSSDGVQAQLFELFWQGGKVYPPHDNNGTPNEDFFKWRNDLYALTESDKHTLRHACETIGCTNNQARYFAYYDKEQGKYLPLNYIEARKKVYFPEYAKLVAGTKSFAYLKGLVEEGKKIALVDFDGYNYNEPCGLMGKYQQYLNKCKDNKTEPTLKEQDFLSVTDMKSAVNCPFMLCGHGFVIKALLQGDLEVKNGEVIDHAGILE